MKNMWLAIALIFSFGTATAGEWNYKFNNDLEATIYGRLENILHDMECSPKNGPDTLIKDLCSSDLIRAQFSHYMSDLVAGNKIAVKFWFSLGEIATRIYEKIAW
jgi:hypothetical protein